MVEGFETIMYVEHLLLCIIYMQRRNYYRYENLTSPAIMSACGVRVLQDISSLLHLHFA